jgi:hypothetical protein
MGDDLRHMTSCGYGSLRARGDISLSERCLNLERLRANIRILAARCARVLIGY